jgi:hypothetical protein
MRNRFRGRVLASSFEGEYRRVSLACPIAGAAASGESGEVPLELLLPSRERPAVGETLYLSVPPDRCAALPGSIERRDGPPFLRSALDPE